jgi:hypothetical protein
MRAMRIGLCAGVLVALSGVPGSSQTGNGQPKMLGGMVLNLPALRQGKRRARRTRIGPWAFEDCLMVEINSGDCTFIG